MKTYKLTLALRSSFATPWQADTIFGHLCWVIAHHQGEEKLKDLISLYRAGEPPFILSNGYPGDFLPKPAYVSLPEQRDEQKAYELKKRVKEIRYLSLSEFNRALNGDTEWVEEYLRREPPGVLREFPTVHSQISRLSGTTQEGALYELKETAYDPSYVSIYIKAVEGWVETIRELFDRLSASGYGKRNLQARAHSGCSS